MDLEFRYRLWTMQILENMGIVKELMPEPDSQGGSIWSWEVLHPESLPDFQWLKENLKANNGKVRL